MCEIGIVAGYTVTSPMWLPMNQIIGTSTKFTRMPPAQKIMEIRRPIT